MKKTINSTSFSSPTSTFTILTCLLLIFLCLPSLSHSELCHKDDKKVLLQIKKYFNNSIYFYTWSPHSDCCSEDWFFVACDYKTHRVVEVVFQREQTLIGNIPSLIADLPFLETLFFHKLPNLTGNIPYAITKLSRLRSIDFSWNGLSGSIPSFLSQIKSLEYINLSFNRFTGSIPPELSLLTNLTYIRFDRNQLTGNIPDSYGRFVGSSPQLYLSHNNLTGTVPKSFGSLNFDSLDLSRNKLEGDVSFLFGKNKTTFLINLSRNMFMFNFSKVVFPKSLAQLDLNHNKIFGSLPDGLLELELQFLNVSYNRLCGHIPFGGSLQRFEATEYFHNKCLCGAPLPHC